MASASRLAVLASATISLDMKRKNKIDQSKTQGILNSSAQGMEVDTSSGQSQQAATARQAHSGNRTHPRRVCSAFHGKITFTNGECCLEKEISTRSPLTHARKRQSSGTCEYVRRASVVGLSVYPREGAYEDGNRSHL